MDIREIKKEIKKIKKIKLACKPGSKERLELHHKIIELKKRMVDHSVITSGKKILIEKILEREKNAKITPTFHELGIDLNKFSEEQLEFHLNKKRN